MDNDDATNFWRGGHIVRKNLCMDQTWQNPMNWDMIKLTLLEKNY